MDKTKKGLIIALVLIALVMVVFVSLQTVQADKSQGNPITGAENKNVPMRLEILNKVLGIPMDSLSKMSPEEIQKLFEDNAEKLGVVVYRAVTDSEGKEVIQKVAGDKVRKVDEVQPPSALISAPYPAPYP